tara:strand:+ start:1057 stop:1629 length:573 start_codon:yes stop_codon:yes gene_type:complete
MYQSFSTANKSSFCVFAGSSVGAKPTYREAAVLLGKSLASHELPLVYGGANIGLMGAVADAVLDNGGQVTGVFPRKLLQKESSHAHLTELILVDSMHERKATMYSLATHFIALPGGLGTFEEVMEILTWSQLGLHTKPCGLLNIENYFDNFLATLQHATKEHFLEPKYSQLLIVEDNASSLLDRLQTPRA